MVRRHRFVGLIAALALLWAAVPMPAALAQAPTAQWTILVYLDADNNLERDAIDDFLEMAGVGSDANVNIVLQFDRVPGYDRRYGDWTGTLRFRVTQGMTPDPENALADIGEANMGAPQTLIDFVRWGMAAYPAQRTSLVLWNHGDGWRTASAVEELRKAICWDLTDGNDALDMLELEGALSALTQGGETPIDLLAFDACLMAMIEIDAQLSPFARFRVSSEETEPSAGYPYDAILADLAAHPEWDGDRLAQSVVERYHEAYNGETMSAVDLGSAHDVLIEAVDGLAQALLEHRATEFAVVESVRRRVQQFYGSYVDLYDLAEQLASASAEAKVRNGAQAVMTAHQAVLLSERHGAYWPGAHGASIYFPAQPASWDDHYAGDANYLRFTAQTAWDEFLMAYLNLDEPSLSLALTGQVLLQGRTSHEGIEISAWPAGRPQDVTTATTDISGTLALTTTAPCTVTAQYAGYLMGQWTIAGTTTKERVLDPVTLLGGDVNADHRIDILDLAYVGAQFGGINARADINGDGSVNILDLAMAGANFGRSVSVWHVAP